MPEPVARLSRAELRRVAFSDRLVSAAMTALLRTARADSGRLSSMPRFRAARACHRTST